MKINIRQAGMADLSALLRFEQGIVEAERPLDSTLKEGPIHYYDIAGMLAADHVNFLVAESGDNLIGCGYARIESAKQHLKHALYGYLGLMYVDPKYRGRSVNGKIIATLAAWCRSRRITELRLEVYCGNGDAIRAYRKAGFTEHMVEMRMSLAE